MPIKISTRSRSATKVKIVVTLFLIAGLALTADGARGRIYQRETT